MTKKIIFYWGLDDKAPYLRIGLVNEPTHDKALSRHEALDFISELAKSPYSIEQDEDMSKDDSLINIQTTKSSMEALEEVRDELVKLAFSKYMYVYKGDILRAFENKIMVTMALAKVITALTKED
ncbi:hypothetical protein [Xylocopilactobacillus apis]|uniref:Uncharacterized protein n=1 Tax=Xylocopilactobacillus apis TaxID=2932183 RepID=A0AAU9DT31_9LACO|nr:hypothetical protein [Xylocopilactobacillus apis]BDR56898.1 hypothetical protein KIMC2_14600 [Xylocopilactobacillus apis]